jgi:hypothetical protein
MWIHGHRLVFSCMYDAAENAVAEMKLTRLRRLRSRISTHLQDAIHPSLLTRSLSSQRELQGTGTPAQLVSPTEEAGCVEGKAHSVLIECSSGSDDVTAA